VKDVSSVLPGQIMNPPLNTCSICDTPLPLHRARLGHLCGNSICQWKHNCLPESQRCRVCDRALSHSQLPFRLCSDPKCFRTRAAERQAAERLKQLEAERELAEQKVKMHTLRDANAEKIGIREPGAYPLAMVPAYSAPIGTLPEKRKRVFLDKLALLIEKVSIGRDGSAEVGERAPIPNPEAVSTSITSNVIERACTECKGSCCRNGDTEAYLIVGTIGRYWDAHPGMRTEEILEAYAARLGETTYEGSCVFHGPHGCGLSRDMRSDTCNDFYCHGLKEYFREIDGQPPDRAFLVSVENDGTIRNSTFIGSTGE